MAGMFSTHMHLPKQMDVQDMVADFWREEAVQSNPVKHTLQPIVTGTSVLGIKCKDGVVIAADTLGSYGSLARFRDISRLMKVNDSTIIGGFGDYADYQHIVKLLNQQTIDDAVVGDGVYRDAPSIHSWLRCVLYNRRTKMNPLWNTVVVAGRTYSGEFYLGYVDKIGVSFTSNSVATGFGGYIAQPMMRKAMEENPDMTVDDAKKLMARCLRVLFYRDCRALNRFNIGIIKEGESFISEPVSADTDWTIGANPSGYE